MAKAILVVATGEGVGLTSVALGLVHALDRRGVPVGFCKPISQTPAADNEVDRSTRLAQRIANLTPPEPLSLERAQDLLGHGRENELLENVVARYRLVGWAWPTFWSKFKAIRWAMPTLPLSLERAQDLLGHGRENELLENVVARYRLVGWAWPTFWSKFKAIRWAMPTLPLTPRTTAWYAKAEVTFSDVLAFVRRTLWAHQYFGTSVHRNEELLFPQTTCEAMLDQLATTA